MRYDLLLDKPCENHSICPGKSISDKDKTKSILSNMIVSLDRLTGNIANVSSFVDEMTLLSIRGAQTPLGQRNHVCTIQSSRPKDVINSILKMIERNFYVSFRPQNFQLNSLTKSVDLQKAY